MPGRDGIAVLEALRGTALPTAVVVVSAFSPAHGARAVDALAQGAFELVAKPSGGALTGFLAELGDKTHAAAAGGARVRPAAVVGPARRATIVDRPGAAPARAATAAPRRAGRAPLVVIASSTGGPRALAELVPRLPRPLAAGALVVQHMPAGFTASLAERLDRASALSVREAREGDVVGRDDVLLAPGGSHLRLRPGSIVALSDDEPIGGLRPRADVTIADAARIYGRRLLLVVLTGMGRDALEGARAVRAAGGRVLAEAESTCTVYGMPRAVAEADLVDGVHPLGDLPDAIARECAA
jgi:two-component system chemotaxis response regulator CheB